jgi:hypothetical protein
MNLRYACMWDLPLCSLAFSGLTALCDRLPRHRALTLALATCAICAFNLHQFKVFTIDGKLYELVPEDLLRAVKMLKT